MSVHDRSVVMICPVADLEQINAISVSMGHTDREFAVALSPTGAEPATHYACCPFTTLGYALMLTQAPAAPDEIEEGDDTLYMPLDADTLAWLRSTLTISVDPPLDPEGVSYPTPRAHFDATLKKAGLVEVASEEEA